MVSIPVDVMMLGHIGRDDINMRAVDAPDNSEHIKFLLKLLLDLLACLSSLWETRPFAADPVL